MRVLHIKAAEQVPGVICHITYSGQVGIEQGGQNLRELVCESVNCCDRAQYRICRSVSSWILTHGKQIGNKAGAFHGNNVEALWCFTGGECFTLKAHSLRACQPFPPSVPQICVVMSHEGHFLLFLSHPSSGLHYMLMSFTLKFFFVHAEAGHMSQTEVL